MDGLLHLLAAMAVLATFALAANAWGAESRDGFDAGHAAPARR
jgi:hypothetical protein